MKNKIKLLYFNSITNFLIISSLFFGGLIWAETNGIWTHAEDLTPGVVGLDQNANNSNNYTFINSVYIKGPKLGSKLFCDENGTICYPIDELAGSIIQNYEGSCSGKPDGFMYLKNSSDELRMCINEKAFAFDMTQVPDGEGTMSPGTYYNVDIHSYLGSPTDPGLYQLTIPVGVKIGSTSTSEPALKTGDFPSGSTLIIVNQGKIMGKGGDGGRGSNGYWYGCQPYGFGGGGGTALELDMDVTIDNTIGFIWGGGNGGNGGACSGHRTGSGGGGGGAGINPGSGGPAGCNSYGGCGGPGSTGNEDFGGNGGAAGSGNPGNGGIDPGLAGNGGGSPGGGFAVKTNGNTITWRGGTADPRIKGSIS